MSATQAAQILLELSRASEYDPKVGICKVLKDAATEGNLSDFIALRTLRDVRTFMHMEMRQDPETLHKCIRFYLQRKFPNHELTLQDNNISLLCRHIYGNWEIRKSVLRQAVDYLVDNNLSFYGFIFDPSKE